MEPLQSIHYTPAFSEVQEGLRVRLRPAPFWKRWLAYSADLGIIGIIMYAFIIVAVMVFAAQVVVARLIQVGDGGLLLLLQLVLAFLLFLMVSDGYFIYCERKWGATPGKRIFGLSVVSLDGRPLSLGQCVIRALLRYVDCMLVLPGVISVLASSKGQRLGDLAAGTMVVHFSHREDAVAHLYLDAESFHYLRDTLAPREPTAEYAQEFLAFAFPYIVRRRPASTDEVLMWSARAGEICEGDGGEVEHRTLIRFVAEVCYQTLNRRG